MDSPPAGSGPGVVPRKRARGARVLVLHRSRILLVEHEDRLTGERFWLLPGGGVEPGETLAEGAEREVLEETGVPVRVVRRLRVRPGPGTGFGRYALFLAEPLDPAADDQASPIVDLAEEIDLRGTAWHPVSADDALGPMNPEYWEFLRPLLRRLIAAQSR